ncbi:hypothetical protein SH449x_003316 [Pirellulaceae bacterium SH449]
MRLGVSYLLLSLSGCFGAVPVPTPLPENGKGVSASSSRTLDIGVIFRDREGYVCFPLEQVGLRPDAAIDTVHSSCDCLQPSVLEYSAPGGSVSRAILLQYRISSASDKQAINEPPMNLGVQVDVGLQDGTTHRFSVNMVYTLEISL